MARFLLIGICCILQCACCFAELPLVTIGLVLDGQQVDESLYIQVLKTETESLLSAEYRVEFRDYFGNWSLESSKIALKKALADSEVDIIIAAGALSTDVVLELYVSPKPIIVPTIVSERLADPDIDGPKYFKERNVAVIKFTPGNPSEEELFYQAAPFDKVAVVAEKSIIDPDNLESVRERLRKRFEIVGAEVVFYPVTNSISGVERKIKEEKVEAIFFLPTWRLSGEQMKTFMETVNAEKIPSFSSIGEFQLDLGVMMTTIPKNQSIRIGRRLALNIQEILLNGDQANLNYVFPAYLEVTINQTVAEMIGIHPSWRFLSEVRFVNIPEPPQKEMSDLCDTAQTAITNNLDLEAEEYSVLGGNELVKIARSFLGPQLDSKLQARFIDADRARLAGGADPQRSIIGGLELKQQIYDDELRADYTIEKWLQSSRIYDLNTFRLDLTFAATVAYLNVLKIRAEEAISKENLELSRVNLKRAQDRVDSGEANKSEVYRWESEIARNQDALFVIQSRIEITETEYNRLLNRPLETSVIIKDIGLSDPEFIFDLDRLGRYLDNSFHIQLFKECMVTLGRYQSPEIKSADSLVGAQARRLLATKRAFYIPKVFLCGEIEDILAKGGAGSSFSPGIKADNFDTTLTIDVRYPIYTSGRRYAERNKASYDLGSLEREREATIQRVDQSVINSIDNMKASYFGIFFANRAAVAAENNLRIVGESYARGVVSIVDLIDAQNNALISRTDASNAVYDFMIDFMALQRSTGKFACFMTPEERACILVECEKYMSMMNRKQGYRDCCYE